MKAKHGSLHYPNFADHLFSEQFTLQRLTLTTELNIFKAFLGYEILPNPIIFIKSFKLGHMDGSVG